MSAEIIEKWSQETIVASNEQNLYDLCLRLGQLGKRDVYLSKDFCWVSTAPSVWPNLIFNFKIDAQNAKGNLQHLKIQVIENGIPNLIVLKRGDSQEKWLMENGVRKINEWAGMAANLADVPIDLPSSKDFSISVVQDEPSLEQWINVVNQGLFNGKELDKELMINLIKMKDIKIFLGVLNGKPVASSLLNLSSGVAGFYLVSTLVEYRGQGIGKRMIKAPLQIAKQEGYKIGILQATTMGEPVYRKLGFQRLFKFGVYSIS